MQTVIAISLLVAAGAFLSWNYVGKKFTQSDNDGDCGPNCKCG